MRKSSVELLRIILIVFLIFSHNYTGSFYLFVKENNPILHSILSTPTTVIGFAMITSTLATYKSDKTKNFY